jgi:hypothetical protein
MLTKFLLENLNGRHHLENVSIARRIILKCLLNKYGVRIWLGFIWLRIGSSGRLL